MAADRSRSLKRFERGTRAARRRPRAAGRRPRAGHTDRERYSRWRHGAEAQFHRFVRRSSDSWVAREAQGRRGRDSGAAARGNSVRSRVVRRRSPSAKATSRQFDVSERAPAGEGTGPPEEARSAP